MENACGRDWDDMTIIRFTQSALGRPLSFRKPSSPSARGHDAWGFRHIFNCGIHPEARQTAISLLRNGADGWRWRC
jgi:hypothetical protein